MAISLNSKTATALRKMGFAYVEVCESWAKPNSVIRKDLLGIGDVIAFGRPRQDVIAAWPSAECLLVQATDITHAASHRRKLRSDDRAAQVAAWLSVPAHRLELWLWYRDGRLWRARREQITTRTEEGVDDGQTD